MWTARELILKLAELDPETRIVVDPGNSGGPTTMDGIDGPHWITDKRSVVYKGVSPFAEIFGVSDVKDGQVALEL